ncbi:MAG: hypothetical protein JSS04_24505 [Proteobacteria bacterium]|nr:hypothetical protein [Pseudomonadota bacterium]
MGRNTLARASRRRLLQLGQPGVERVLGLLRGERRAAVMQVGAPSLKDLAPGMVRRA